MAKVQQRQKSALTAVAMDAEDAGDLLVGACRRRGGFGVTLACRAAERTLTGWRGGALGAQTTSELWKAEADERLELGVFQRV